jgi:hypothetical protein
METGICRKWLEPVLFELLILICEVAELGIDVQLGRFVVRVTGRKYVNSAKQLGQLIGGTVGESRMNTLADYVHRCSEEVGELSGRFDFDARFRRFAFKETIKAQSMDESNAPLLPLAQFQSEGGDLVVWILHDFVQSRNRKPGIFTCPGNPEPITG